MTSKTQHAGSNLAPDAVELQPVYDGSESRQAPSQEQGILGLGSFTANYQWRGNGKVLLNLRSNGINAGSRVFTSVSEYNTSWNANRFIGNAHIAVSNVAPYNGGAWLWLNVDWSGPINISVSLLVDP